MLDSKKFKRRSIHFSPKSALIYAWGCLRGPLGGPNLTAPDKKTFVAELEKEHGQRLRRFLASKLRHRIDDAPDLAQEIFLRFLRINRHESIRSPEAYLYTVAFHVLHQDIMRRAEAPEAVEITALIDQMESEDHADPLAQAETQEQLEELQEALDQLSPKARTVLILHRRDGMTLEEIATQLGFSRANAAKYLAKALVHCRQHLRQERK